MNTEQALQELLKPFYDKYAEPDETIEQFTDYFLNQGGKIQILIPPIIQKRIREEDKNELSNEDQDTLSEIFRY